MTTYRRRPLEVQAVQFLKAGDHPMVESRWARKVEDRPACRDFGAAEVFDFHEGDPWDSPLCSESTPGAVMLHTLIVPHKGGKRMIPVSVGEWIVTEHGETRVVPDAEFQRDYEAWVSFCDGSPVIEFATEKLDWSDVK